MMSVFSRAGAGIQNILSEWRQPASRSSLCVGSFLFGRESGHSIARPIACGNRVPPQRTVLRETPRVLLNFPSLPRAPLPGELSPQATERFPLTKKTSECRNVTVPVRKFFLFMMPRRNQM